PRRPRRSRSYLSFRGEAEYCFRRPAGTAKQGSSDLQSMKIWNAGFHHFQVHFNEVVFYAARFRGGEDFIPIESILSYRHDFLGLCGPALNVHGEEAAGVFTEIIRGVVATADGGDL